LTVSESISAVGRDKWEQISLLNSLSKTFQVYNMHMQWDSLSTAEVYEWIYIRVTHRNHSNWWVLSDLLNLPVLHSSLKCMVFHSHWSQKLDYRLPSKCSLVLHIPGEVAALSVWYNICQFLGILTISLFTFVGCCNLGNVEMLLAVLVSWLFLILSVEQYELNVRKCDGVTGIVVMVLY
jgi:hypothetical protein